MLPKVKVRVRRYGNFGAFAGKVRPKNLIGLYLTTTRRLAGKIAERELKSLLHHPRKMRARGWKV